MRHPAEPTSANLLFVCTGNICRSAAADRMMSVWANRGGRPVAIRSAGTHARPGRPVHPLTERALARYEIRPDSFTSRRLSAPDVDWADLVLTMTDEHREHVVGVNPRGMSKVFTLLEAAALAQTLAGGAFEPRNGERRGTRLAGALRDARARHARANGPAFNVTDPIDGPPALHAEVVDQIAAAIDALVPVLDVPGRSEQTAPMRRLPPVPRPS